MSKAPSRAFVLLTAPVWFPLLIVAAAGCILGIALWTPICAALTFILYGKAYWPVDLNRWSGMTPNAIGDWWPKNQR